MAISAIPKTKLAVAVSILCSGISAPALSQGQSARLEEVIVTAQKREQNVNEIGMAISAFSGENLKALGVIDTRDLTNFVPGFTVAQSDLNTPIYTLRGVGFNTPNLSSTSPVGVYVDEASFPYPYMSNGLIHDLERVEVLKGPQGTLYGRNTTGGLVNFITNRPTDDFEASITARAGNYESYGLEGFVSGPISDSWGARFAFSTLNANKGWQESFSRPGDRNGEQDRLSARLLLDFDPNDRFRANLTFSYWKDEGDTLAGQAVIYNPAVFNAGSEAQALELFGSFYPPGTTGQEIAEDLYVTPGLKDQIISNPDTEDADWAAADQPGYWPGTTFTNPRPERGVDSDMLSFTARLDYELTENLTLVSLTNYADLERDDVSDRGGVMFEMATDRELGSIESVSQEFRLAGSAFDGRTNYIAGVYYANDELDDRGQVWAGQNSVLNELRLLVGLGAESAGAPSEAVDEIYGGFRNWENFSKISTEMYAVFGQFDHQLSDSFTLTAGARYTDEKQDFRGCSRDYLGDTNIHQVWNPAFGTALAPGDCVTLDSTTFLPVGPRGAEKELNEDNVSWRLALDWTPSDNTLIYGSVANGFKSGVFPQLAANADAQYDPAVQEEVLAYELGAKFSPTSILALNAAVYYYDYKDKQDFNFIPDPVFVTLTKVVNLDESEVYGAEFDATLYPTENTLLKLSASYLETEITRYQGFDERGLPADFAGASFAYAPEWQFNFIGAHRFDVTNTIEGSLMLDAAYSDSQSGTLGDDPTFAIDSYTLVGARLGLGAKDQQWEVAVFGRNLTDEYYWTSVHNWGDAIVRYAGMPRTYGVEFTLNFD